MERGGFGYLRSPANDYAPSDQDPVVPIDLIEDWNLEEGCFVEGRLGPPMKPGLGPTLTAVTEIDGGPPQRRREAPVFDSLTAVSPTERFVLPSLGGDLCVRAIELVAPIGRGQRAVIVAPPKSGKTVLLRLLAQGLVRTSPSVKLLVLLVDERPEEVTDFRRVLPGIEVVASSMDRMAQGHIRAAELLMARARRLVEAGKDVVVLLDSLTRLARAYNNALPGGGRTLSGGLDARAMAKPREFFGAARKIEGGGSLTIIATCLVDTGSQMDEVIFREFKGTGNMELVLDRSLAEKRIFPAFDVRASGTRKDESLFTPKELDAVHRIRQAMLRHSPADAMLALLGTLRQTRDNADLLARLTAQNGSASS